MGWFKNFLKRFLPPPVNVFNREIDATRQLIKEENASLQLKWNQKIEQVLKILAQQQKLLNVQQWQFETMANKLHEVRSFQQVLDQHILELSLQAQDNRQQLLLDVEQRIQEQGQQLLLGIEQQMHEQMQSILALDKFFDMERSLKISIDEVRSSIEKEIHTLESKQLEEMKKVQKDIANISEIVPNQPILWSNDFEKRVIEANWGNIMQSTDFADKFIRLTRGMDAKSVETVIRILIRQNAYLHTNAKSLDLFTRKEQEELRLLKENFNSEIIKLNDSLFAYRNYLLPVHHFESSVFYYKHGIADLNDPSTVKGKAIIDVGGFIGDSVLVLSELEPSTIYTFEAVPENFELLKKTIELNNVPNIVAENMALGAKCGTLTIHTCGSGSTSIERPGLVYKEDIEVPVTTLDKYIAEHGIDVGLIKVDIEGGEPAFLEGARKTICEQKPILLLSIYHNAHDFFELKPLIESWNLGYRFKVHKPTFGNVTSETLLLAEVEN